MKGKSKNNCSKGRSVPAEPNASLAALFGAAEDKTPILDQDARKAKPARAKRRTKK